MEENMLRMGVLRPCRYLEGLHRGGRLTCWCAYYDYELRGNEDLWCHPGGCPFYESPGPPGAVIYEDDRWMTVAEYGEWLYTKPGIPEGYEFQDWKIEMERA